MLKSAKARAQITLAPNAFADNELEQRRDDARQKRKDHMDRLRAQRTARDMAEAAAVLDAAKTKPARMPRAHRRSS